MLRVAAADFVDQLVGLGRDVLAAEPLIVVDCSGPNPRRDAGLEWDLAALPAVVVAVGAAAGDPLAAGLDLDLGAGVGDESCLGLVEQAMDAHRAAAVSLAVLLRGGAHRSVPENLVAESTTYAMLQAGPDHQRWLHDRAPRRDAPAPEADVVDLERNGDELVVTLNRPAVRNAFSSEVRDRLLDALAVAAADPDVRVTLRGRGQAFCSGGDLNEFGTTPDPATAHLVRLRRNVGLAVAAIAERVTVHVHGACVGAGVELPAFARRVVAAPGTTFWLPEIAMGLIPGAGGTASIPRRIGRQRALLLALLGEPVDATTALAWGLVDEITEGDRTP